MFLPRVVCVVRVFVSPLLPTMGQAPKITDEQAINPSGTLLTIVILFSACLGLPFICIDEWRSRTTILHCKEGDRLVDLRTPQLRRSENCRSWVYSAKPSQAKPSIFHCSHEHCKSFLDILNIVGHLGAWLQHRYAHAPNHESWKVVNSTRPLMIRFCTDCTNPELRKPLLATRYNLATPCKQVDSFSFSKPTQKRIQVGILWFPRKELQTMPSCTKSETRGVLAT